MPNHTVSGGGGAKLHVAEHGNPNGQPILFIHGWSQCELCWSKQYEAAELSDFRLLGLDLRGHGMSERPGGQDAYADGRLWAEDIAAAIAELELEKPVLVGWSYGGFVIGDYLREFGTSKIGGINLVAAGILLGPEAFGTLIGPAFLKYAPPACTPDLGENIQAVRSFIRACTAEPLGQDDFEICLAFNMAVPSWVRGHLIQRELDFTSTFAHSDTQLLVTHGMEDKVVLPAMSHRVLDNCPGAEASWYDGVGHAAFLECSDRFNRELAAFARTA